MKTQYIKGPIVCLLLLLGLLNSTKAQIIESPLTWTKNQANYIADEILPANTDGYLDFVWDGNYVYYGFNQDQSPNNYNEIQGGLILFSNGGGSFMNIIDNGTITFLSYPSQAGDQIRLARMGSEFIVYKNGIEAYRWATDATQIGFPYMRDQTQKQYLRLEYFLEAPTFPLDWIATKDIQGSNNQFTLASNELRRGQDGVLTYAFDDHPFAHFGFTSSKSIAVFGTNYVARALYRKNQTAITLYVGTVPVGVLNVELFPDDEIKIERKGSTVIFSAKGLKKEFPIDGNIDWHPFVLEYKANQRNQVASSFATQGGVCDDYFEILPDYIDVEAALFYPPSPTEEGWNYIHTKVYNGQGEGPCHVISESRSYTDELGRGVQSQSKDYLQEKVWANQTLYDYLGRPALSSLSAPTGLDILQYNGQFIRDAQGNNYGADDFDRVYATDGTLVSNITDNPAIVGGIYANTLGAWYSSTNTEEPWQATTAYPYTRTEYSELTGGARRTSAPGDAYKMGGGHEVSSYSMRTGDELRYVFGTKKPICKLMGTSYADGPLNGNCMDDAPANNSRYFKTIAIDADGRQAVMFYDESGNEIAKALSGKVDGSNVLTQTVTMGVPHGQYRDFHVTDADNSINVWNSSNPGTKYDVYDLATDEKIISEGTASPMTLNPGFYRFVPLEDHLTLNYDLNYHNFSLSIYDKRNQLIATVAPNDVVHVKDDNDHHNAHSFYYYNSYGQLFSMISPDAGTTVYFYRRDGQVRFSRNAQQIVEGKYSYVKYDAHGRIVETGENSNYDYQTVTTNLENDDFPSSNNTDVNSTHYDIGEPSLPSNRQQRFVGGLISHISNIDGTTYYSYDEEGRLEWMGQQISGISTIKFTDYKYDLLGNVTEVIYQDEAIDEFRHHYTYDQNSQLRSVSTRTDDAITTVPQIHAQYAYSQGNELRGVNIADGRERQRYVYTISGRLKAINPKDLADAEINAFSRRFSMALDYYVDDYIAANGQMAGKASGLFDPATPPAQANYSGQIAAQRWKGRASIGGVDFSGHYAYAYQYNHRNELLEARFGQIGTGAFPYSGHFSPMLDYSLYITGAQYDLNGNIQALKRFGQNNVLLDDLIYDYDQVDGKNQLTRIRDTGANGTAGDLTDQVAGNYSYNALGQLIDDKADNNSIEYDSYGRVISVEYEDQPGALKVKYVYGPDGQRLKKLSYGSGNVINKTTWYFRGVNGAIQGIYEQENGESLELTEMALHGAGRMGTAMYNGGNYSFQYELKDHLGNVRAVIKPFFTVGTSAAYYADYYPFGWTMPGRNGGSSRYGYQGEYAERDEEVGWNAFDLRMYDGRIARWTSIDPAEEFWSPYVSMGNNPVNLTDPTGGMTDPPSEGAGRLQFYMNDPEYVMALANGSDHSFDSNSGFGILGTFDFANSEIRMSMGNSMLFAGISREIYHRNLVSLQSAFTSSSGTIDYVAGAAERTRLKGWVRRRLTPLHIKVFLDEFWPNRNKYDPITRPTPRFWYSNIWVTRAARLSGTLGLASVGLDAVGIHNYYRNPGASIVTDPVTGISNIGVTGIMYYGGGIGFGVGFTYFGVRGLLNIARQMTDQQMSSFMMNRSKEGVRSQRLGE